MRKPKAALLINLFVSITAGAFSAFLAVRELISLSYAVETKRPLFTIAFCAFTLGFCLYNIFLSLKEYLKS